MTSTGPTTAGEETDAETTTSDTGTDTETTTTTSDTDATTSGCMDGSEGCPCDRGECDDDLVCEEDLCVAPPPAGCGNGTLEEGEECDDGPENGNSAACKSNCTLQVCGDGAVGPGESCDDGNDDDDGCNNACELASCGDGKLDQGEECDDGNDDSSDGCLNTCKAASCGDMFTQQGVEECDDGNGVNSDECTAQCTVAICGDSYVLEGVEECDDGNQNPDDGCSDQCELSERQVYLVNANNGLKFYRYDIVSDLWSTKASLPSPTRTQLTNDGTYVYAMGVDNRVYKYNPESGQWADEMEGPGDVVANAVGFFEWFSDGFYYLNDGDSTMHVHRGNVWSSFDLGGEGSSAGTYDMANDELYIRTMWEMGFRVVDTTDDSIARVITDMTHVAENSRTGSYSDGDFYVRTTSGPLQRLDAQSGTKINTMASPLSSDSGSDTDFMTGYIYLLGISGQNTGFQRYDPADNSFTKLAEPPGVPQMPSLTVIRPLN